MIAKMAIWGKEETQFWVRAFQLEEEIERVRKIVLEMPDHAQKGSVKFAMVPIIYDYQAGNLRWVMFFGAEVDSIGIQNGYGKIWLLAGDSLGKLEEIREQRDRLAAETLGSAEKHFDEVREIGTGREV